MGKILNPTIVTVYNHIKLEHIVMLLRTVDLIDFILDLCLFANNSCAYVTKYDGKLNILALVTG